jgi:hypothetical protein
MPRKLPRSYIRSLEWDAEMVEVGPHRFVNRAIELKKKVATTLPSSPAMDWPCKGIAWDCPGHSPITKSDRLDARFVNSLGKPPRKGKQIVGPAPDIERSNLEPGESVFDRRKLPFDRGRFKTGHRLDYTDYRLPDYEHREVGRLAVAEQDTNTGANVPAVWEREKKGRGRASVGGDVSAKSTAKFGSTSYEYLTRRARQPLNLVNLGRPLAALMQSRRYRPKKTSAPMAV